MAEVGWPGEVGSQVAWRWSRAGWPKRGVFTQMVAGVPSCKAMRVLERRWEHPPSYRWSDQAKLFRESKEGEGIFVQKRESSSRRDAFAQLVFGAS